MDTRRASESGLILIDRARRRLGWNKSGEAWCQAAYTSRSTLNRFWSRQPIRQDAFVAICSAVGVSWEQVVATAAEAPTPDLAPPGPAGRQDWGEAPDIPLFCGRHPELATLEQWAGRDRCRLILISGMGGMGKTALAIKSAQQLTCQTTIPIFDQMIWRSLRNGPPLDRLLTELIQILAEQQAADLATSLSGKLARLLDDLRRYRCLLILDNAEAILQSRDRQGSYRPGYEGYEQLFQAIGDTDHSSCLYLTSREKPKGLAALEGDTLPVRCLQLSGLPETAVQTLFKAKGTFTGTETAWSRIGQRYGGNPLALKIAASAVKDLFEGNLNHFLAFLAEHAFIFDDIRDLLAQQFSRLPPLEQTLMYWLAISREPITLATLQAKLLIPVAPSELLKALAALQNRSLIEKKRDRYTQQPVIMEFVSAVLIEQVCTELESGQIALLKSHALIEARAKDYVRETQSRFILQRVVDGLTVRLGSLRQLEAKIQAVLTQLRTTRDRNAAKPHFCSQEIGYACGNLINLLSQMQADLNGYDFSGMPVFEANLQGINLHQVNFSRAELGRAVFTETLGNVLSAAFSPDGQLLATCDTDCQIRLWQVQTGQLRLICRGHSNWVRSVAFSPDGQTLVSGGADQTVRCWEVATGRCLSLGRGHRGEVYAVAFSPQGHQLASSSGDGTLRLWNRDSGQCGRIFSGHSSWVRSVVFSPDGRTLASGSDDQTLKLWDCQTGHCLQTLTGHGSWVRSVAFSPEGQTLASGSGDRTLKLWDYQTGRCLKTYSGHSDGVYSIAFSRDGAQLVSGSGDHTAKLWDRATGQCLKTLSGHCNQINAVALSPDGQTLACVSLDQTVKLWDAQSGNCFKTWQSHTDWAFPVAIAPAAQLSAAAHLESADNLLITGSSDRSIRLWNIETGKNFSTLQGHTDQVFSLSVSAASQRLASGGTDRTVRLWSLSSGQCLRTLQGHRDWVRTVALSSDGSFLVSGSDDQTIRFWDVNTGQCLKTLNDGGQVYSIALSRDATTLASGSTDPTVRLWDVETGCCIKTFVGHTNRVFSVALSPDGQTLASGSTDCTIRLWNTATGQCLRTLAGHENWVFSVAISPNGKRLASAAHDQTMRVWNLTTGECLHVCRGHTHLVSFVRFSSSGKRIASGSQDQTARLWDAETGHCLQVFRANRLYEGMNITGAQGLTQAQRDTLAALGAVDYQL
ncbi:hypothetical protein IQ241_08755 [Romeria aff. gracilis LEGE 07310]|uniref:NB-ARC domain-containing protein n=1 Tax=Vasconcelosia minhoensis LEGE 07310 TaxID=915328 RepID=A0A8J7ALW1_9CYAN|nr:NB-ARC domain-containing protein [Romeria gracilis]MBE9077385.1 hypothetical protein [Romeria aff. gracilis LEGE 07310]